MLHVTKRALEARRFEDMDIAALKDAAEGGHPEAMYQLARRHHHGSRGAGMDLNRAAYWYHRAAKHKHRNALFSLAVLYDFGTDVVQANGKRARALYRQAGWPGIARVREEEEKLRRQGVPRVEEPAVP